MNLHNNFGGGFKLDTYVDKVRRTSFSNNHVQKIQKIALVEITRYHGLNAWYASSRYAVQHFLRSLQKTHQEKVISESTFTLALPCEVCANNKQIDEDRRAWYDDIWIDTLLTKYIVIVRVSVFLTNCCQWDPRLALEQCKWMTRNTNSPFGERNKLKWN